MNDLLTQLIECNQWHFIGRLGADPEIRYLQTGQSVCNARLLVNKPGQKRDDGQQPYGFKLTVWGEKAQGFADAAGKGDLIDVCGRCKPETWTDRNTGEQRSGVVMTVDAYEVLAKPGQNQQAAAPAPATSAWAGAAPAPAPQARPATPTSPPVWGSSAADDSDIPF
jgi:single-strand DNA-binding protein